MEGEGRGIYSSLGWDVRDCGEQSTCTKSIDFALRLADPLPSQQVTITFTIMFFPLLLQAVLEVAAASVGRPLTPSRRLLAGLALLTGAFFAAIQLSTAASSAYSWGLGALQWPARWVAGAHSIAPVHHVADAEDLWALPGLVVAVAVGWRRCGYLADGRSGSRPVTPPASP